jgi:hypothetical protein
VVTARETVLLLLSAFKPSLPTQAGPISEAQQIPAMEQPPSVCTTTPPETTTKKSSYVATDTSSNGTLLNSVAGHIRRRVVSFSRPATPPAISALAQQHAADTHRNQKPSPNGFDRSSKSPLSPKISDAITTMINTSSTYQVREPWDVTRSPENQSLRNEFIKHCTVPILSPPALSSSSPCTNAHIALACFTPLQKLRAVLVGSNKKAFRIGEVYESPLETILEPIPTSADVIPSGEWEIPTSVSKQLQKDFDLTAQLMENFIFPVKLIEPFNMAIRLINRSQFLRYLLARWNLTRNGHKSEVVSTNQIGGRRIKQTKGTRSSEIIFLEWYLASSPSMISIMLNVLRGRDCTARERLVIDLHGNALARQNEPMAKVLSRELEILATIRRDLSVAIDTLFWQRVEMVRTIGDERHQESHAALEEDLVVGEKGRTKGRKERSGHTRDDEILRVKIGIRCHTWAVLSAGATDVVDDELD